MTKNDFPSPLHKEKQVQGHSCCRRLMVLPDAGTVERGDQPMVLFTKLGEDKAAIREAWDRHKQRCLFIIA